MSTFTIPGARTAAGRRTARLAAVAAGAAGVLALSSATASAHVSVNPEGSAPKGGYATVGFKVPNERDDASTVKLEVTFPEEHPLSSVMPQPVPGWTAKVSKRQLDKPLKAHGHEIDEVVSKVTWTADGKGVAPGYFQKFPVSLGALPEDTDTLVFKAVQTYSNKEVVRWIEPQQEGQEEPESPAPVLNLTAAEEGHGGPAAGDGKGHGDEKDAADGAASAGTGEQAAGDSDSSDTFARVLGVVGILVGAAGVAFGVLAGRRRTSA